MANKNLLISWIGYADLKSIEDDLPVSKHKMLFGKSANIMADDNKGPIKTLLKCISFDEVHLLENYPIGIAKHYAKSVDSKVILHHVKLKNPIDYKEVFKISDNILSDIVAKQRGNYQLNIHLSSGTPAMAAVWVLLGKTKYPAKFYQTYNKKAIVTDIPFDISVDFVPKLLRDSDFRFQHLASKPPSEIEGFDSIIGNSKAIRIAAGRAAKAASRDVTVLISGSTGTGKEMFARSIHNASKRKDGPFISINCAAIPSSLLESELFGYKKGAFTGADSDHQGAFEAADKGTLFLDEIGECDKAMQAKLLRVLQPIPNQPLTCRTFRRIGDNKERVSDVRIIAATNRNLAQEVSENSFREDLYYRLAVITIKLPALCERKEDIVAIAEHLLARINDEFRGQEPGYKDKKFSNNTKRFIQNLPWPGNIRQLYNTILQAAVMSEKDILSEQDIASAVNELAIPVKTDETPITISENFNLDDYLNSLRRRYLSQAMKQAGGVKTKAARLLGMKNYQTLDAQLKRFGLE